MSAYMTPSSCCRNSTAFGSLPGSSKVKEGSGAPVGSRNIVTPFGEPSRVVRTLSADPAPVTDGVDGFLVQHTTAHDAEAFGLEAVRGCAEPVGQNVVVVFWAIAAAAAKSSCRPDGRPGRDMDLFALGHQRVSGQRVGVLATDQSPDAAVRRVGDAQAKAIAGAPRQLLEEGGHQLPVMGSHVAGLVDDEVRVVQAGRATARSLRDADADDGLSLARRVYGKTDA
ncbi:hypothetical protein OPQ81_010406 [Rhizoctonia solani]|nr:hypothetical protein OPQ81_010406 [Rhizoctonia solani]